MKIRTVMSAVVLAGSMLVALPAPASAVAVSDTFEAAVIASTNQQRVARQKVKLAAQSCVDRYAEAQAKWMAANRKMKHQPMKPILKACKLKSVGENIAWGFTTGPLTVTAWMRSTGHRANILKPGYRLIGVGAYQDKYGRWWVSQVFGTKK